MRRRIVAGITGLGEPQGPAALALRSLLGQALGLAPERIHCDSDIALAWHALYRPGEGYLLYAGTGAIAAFMVKPCATAGSGMIISSATVSLLSNAAFTASSNQLRPGLRTWTVPNR